MELSNARSPAGGNVQDDEAERREFDLLVDLIIQSDFDDADALAERIMTEFGSLRATLAAAGTNRLENICSSTRVVRHIRIIRDMMLHCLRAPVATRPVLGTSVALMEYLSVLLAEETVERFIVLYLDSINGLIREEEIARGTIDKITVHPRTVLHRALDLGAAGMILVHNHPSGVASPSGADRSFTRRVAELAHSLDIVLHDHVIVGRGQCVSMRALGLI